MKKIKLHQWLALLFFTTLCVACSKKVINSGIKVDVEMTKALPDSLYTPPAFIIIPDNKAKINKEDELYYDDAYGYRYWRYNDGKYYLDKKYTKTPLAKRNTPAVAKLIKP